MIWVTATVGTGHVNTEQGLGFNSELGRETTKLYIFAEFSNSFCISEARITTHKGRRWNRTVRGLLMVACGGVTTEGGGAMPRNRLSILEGEKLQPEKTWKGNPPNKGSLLKTEILDLDGFYTPSGSVNIYD